MWEIEDSPGPKVAYRGGWYHSVCGYTTALDVLQGEHAAGLGYLLPTLTVVKNQLSTVSKGGKDRD